MWRHLREPPQLTLEDQVRVSQYQGAPTRLLQRSIIDIATRQAKKPQFVTFNYREDMINEAVVQMMKAWKNIQLDKCQNGSASVYGYFVTITNQAFISFLHNEKRQRQIKEELLDRQINS
jgi:DNA-directed RNA polymerase specialized sigma24 family protein